MRVLVADDHPVVRAGVRMLINSETDLEVIGEASDGAECLEQVAKLKPDVVLLDLSMPHLEGVSALRVIAQRHPGVHVLVLTMHEDPVYARQILDAGGSGFLIKRAVDVELATAIRAVHRGEVYLHSSLTGYLLDVGTEGRREARGAADLRPESLSQREQQVLQLLAHGYTNQQVADRIFVSVKTVETYRARVQEKLNLKTRAELTRYAIEHGLLGKDEPPAR
ncbi:MAG: response regulator transcription factor [candidate division NC10 bacterium]|nr:response regulator transcription factor [candidate division NC10 bacterium]